MHNPHNLAGIEAVEEEFPEKPQVAAFDTGIHQSMPEKAYRYAIPERYYEEHGIRRYGFHGLSHRYLRMRCRQILNIDYDDIKVVTCHLGNGASLAAFDGIEVQDTSMGFTPLEGLVMGTRSGDIDPAVVTYIMSLEDFSREEIDRVLNKESGLLGLSGQTNNMKLILDKMKAGDEKCELAVKVFCHRLKKYISAYQGILNGAHAVVFSGGIGENAAEIRRRSANNLEALGIKIDSEINEGVIGEEKIISPEDSPTEVMVIPTNEELMIARDTARCLE
ncbi:MAG: acetate/propionate family kinase [bacterium]